MYEIKFIVNGYNEERAIQTLAEFLCDDDALKPIDYSVINENIKKNSFIDKLPEPEDIKEWI